MWKQYDEEIFDFEELCKLENKCLVKKGNNKIYENENNEPKKKNEKLTNFLKKKLWEIIKF